jgi:hypothetical protein
MSDQDIVFELSQNIERYLATLSKVYVREGQKQLGEIIANSQFQVIEQYSYDNWNGGTYGHALHLILPEPIYLSSVKDKTKIQDQIKQDLNKIHNVQNEFIDAVFLDMEITDDSDWRKESGLQISAKRTVSISTTDRIWGKNNYRIFLTHKTEVKKETAALKDRLKIYGISCFVAHEDIHPTKEWQTEIENALNSMDALVALITEEFHDSDWTDQEIGFAFGRNVPIISVKLGKDPYGFLGKFQALSCSWDSAAKEIAKILIKYDHMVNSFIRAVKDCGSFDDGNTLAELLPFINGLNEGQVLDLISAYNENGQVRASYGFNGSRPYTFGNGLLSHLLRWTGNNYKFNRDGKIQI